MTITVVLETDNDGRLVVRKAATDGPLPELLAESQWLETARRPGIVELLSPPNDLEIVTRHAGSTTVRTAGLTEPQAIAVLSSVAETLADLSLGGLVHGNLDADHILTDGQTAVIISPSGTATDPIVDLSGLGSVIGVLRRQWDAAGADHNERRWEQLETELTDPTTTLTARRVASLLQTMGAPPAEPAAPARRVSAFIGPLAAAAGALTVIAAALMFWPGDPANSNSERIAGTASGTEVVAGEHLVRVGAEGDVVVGLTNPCPGQPVAALLRPETDQVWAFESVEAEAHLWATVTGATELEVKTSGGCEVVNARGPAGERELGT